MFLLPKSSDSESGTDSEPAWVPSRLFLTFTKKTRMQLRPLVTQESDQPAVSPERFWQSVRNKEGQQVSNNGTVKSHTLKCKLQNIYF